MKFVKKIIVLLFYLTSIITHAQFGIGTTSPTQELDVVGDIEFSGVLLPNGDAGTAGKILLSNATASPTWSITEIDATGIAKIGKGYVNWVGGTPGDPPSPLPGLGSFLRLTLTDPNCTPNSTATVSWIGGFGTNPDYGELTITVEARTGEWVLHIRNNTGYTLIGYSLSLYAFY